MSVTTRERTDLGTDTGPLPVSLARTSHWSSDGSVTGPAVICRSSGHNIKLEWLGKHERCLPCAYNFLCLLKGC